MILWVLIFQPLSRPALTRNRHKSARKGIERYVFAAFNGIDLYTQPVYGLCMATKTISIETDAYELLAREKKDHTESFSRVIRRLFAERPALTAGELLDAMHGFNGKGAGPRRKAR